jgi:predicted AAA+ superfamily ATPase
LYQITQYIGQNPGTIINNLHLASELKVSNKTIALYLSYLEDSLLIKKLYNFSRNFFTSQRKLKKYYLASPSLSLALTDFVDQGKIFENYFISQNDWQYFFRDPAKHEVDFVAVDKNKKILPIEIKFKKEIKKEDLKNLIIFMKKYRLNQAYVFYYQPNQKTIKINNKKIVFLPYYQSI